MALHEWRVTEILTLESDSHAEPLTFRLEPGHDLRLVIEDEYGRPAAGATVTATVAATISTEASTGARIEASRLACFGGASVVLTPSCYDRQDHST